MILKIISKIKLMTLSTRLILT